MTETGRRNAFGQRIGDAVPGWVARPWPPRTALEGRFCRLEPLDAARHADDLHAAYAQATDARDWTYLSDERENCAAAFRARIAARAASTDPLHMAVLRGRTALGTAALMRIDPDNGVLEIGHIHFGPAMQRTPMATEAVFLLMSRAFALGYRRLEWKCDALNAPSRRAAQRYGFSFEGTFRDAVVVKKRSRDTSWYAIVAREWPQARSGFERWLSPANFDADGRQIADLATLRAADA